MFIKATDIRKGMVLRFKNKPVKVLESVHHTPGNLRAMMQVEMKELASGTKQSNRFRADETVEKLNVDFVEMEYLYQEGDDFVFMNSSNYEQIYLNKDLVAEAAGYLLPNSKVSVSFIEEKPVSIEIPQKVTLKVIETEPGIRNATATNVMKPAKLETGITVPVPPFIEVGESIVVNTESGAYVSRA